MAFGARPPAKRPRAGVGLPADTGSSGPAVWDEFDPMRALAASGVAVDQDDDETDGLPAGTDRGGINANGPTPGVDAEDDTPDSSGSSLGRAADDTGNRGSSWGTTAGHGMADSTTGDTTGMDNTLAEYDGPGLFTGDLTDPDTRAAIAALYGDDCPLLVSDPADQDWVSWAQHLWNSLGPGQQAAVHLVERNRLYYKGMQWISAIGFGPWREPMRSQDTAKIVENMIAPALDQRVEIIAEQRPGFLCEPEQIDPDSKKRADAQQAALEYQWEQQNMRAIARECAHWAGTDGVTFLETYWDVNAGPWSQVPRYENPEEDPTGYHHMPLGDVRCRNLQIEQVRVSTEASMTKRPWLWVVREIIPKSLAVRMYGVSVANEIGTYSYDDNLQHVPAARMGFLLPEKDEILRQQDVVARLTVYAEKSEFLPFAMQMTVIGDKLVVPPMPIPIGRVPLLAWRDGTRDPSFYPLPEMHWWIDAQTRYNALWSKIVEGIRKQAGINLLARENTLSGETLISGGMNVWGVKGGGSLQDVVREIGGTGISSDVMAALQATKAMFERITGWNDTTTGSFSPDASGRAILAMREQVERIFAPMVTSASEAMCDWGEQTLAWMKWGYELPRAIRVTGKSRPDLGRMIVQAQDFDDVAQVNIDPETLMPMPRALRLSILDDLFQKGVMDPKEYRRRMPYAYAGSLETPDEAHEARAYRVAETIKQDGQPLTLPILWQDNEAIHQDVLEREIILRDDLPTPIRLAAHQRWEMLAQQAQMKSSGAISPAPGGPELGAPPPAPPPPPALPQMGGPPGPPAPGGPPPGPGGPPGAPHHGPAGPPNNPGQTGLQGPARFMGPAGAPTAASNPPIAAVPSPIDQTAAAQAFERSPLIR